MTQNNQNIGTLVTAEVLLQYDATIAKAARRCVAKVPYDLSLGMEELQMDALCEAKIAVVDGLHLYNPALSSLETFINTKVYWHFKELQRRNAQHCEREVLRSALEMGCAKYRDDDDYGDCDYMEADVAEDLWEAQERQRELESAIDAMMRFALPGEQTICLQQYLEALKSGESKPVPCVAEALGWYRQKVYSIINDVLDQLPAGLKNEIRDLF